MNLDGATTYPQVAIELSIREIKSSFICSSGRLSSESKQAVNHGLFAGREKQKHLLIPAFEQRITETFQIAFERSFQCMADGLW